MSEREMFAEMFGEKAEKPKTEEAKAETAAETPEKAPAEPQVEEKREDAHPEAPADGEEDEGVDQKLIDDAKKELGIGGAAFCDELLAGTPDAFSRLGAAGKTLHGFYNFAYSYAMDEYVKANGRVNGGGYWNLSELLGKYLDPSVKEGFTVKEPKAKKVVPPNPSESPAKTVAKVAKKAAKAAKREAKKESLTKVVEPERKAEPKQDAAGPREKIDLSKISFKGIDFKSLFGGK